MKFDDLKQSSAGTMPTGLTHSEQQAWRCMSYLYALYKFGHVTKEQCKTEYGEIELNFYGSLTPYEKAMQHSENETDPLACAYALMKAQPDKEKFAWAMGELKGMVGK